ncbi:MAG: 2Fe-2S iron-sulfur cluster-binding protein [Bacillota bacterium]|nr:2Fe-2S iron-sulfur cluster-binding protein [Bacillota bacterium]
MKKTVSVTIDDKRIIADEGTTILEAARQNNIDIPTLCHHPRLEPMGHCRICIVEVEGMKRPVTSCDNPVTDGMVIKTDSSRLQTMRSRIIELSLSTHPYKDCLTCVRTGSCELQEKAYEYQVNLPDQLSRDIPSGDNCDNRDIIRDEEKCILCGRCIQVCRSGPGRFVYSMIGNGVNTRVAPVKDGQVVSLEEAGCIFCGQCVDLCPVAALTETGRSSGGREWELDKLQGVCNECSLGCYLERYSSDRKLIRITVPRDGDKISWLCVKGRFGFKEIDKKDRISLPLKRNGKTYSETSYEDALREAAENIKKIKETAGPDSIAILASGKLSNEENYLLQKLARTVIATPHLDLGAEIAWVNAYLGAVEITGANVQGPTPADIGYASVVTIIGSDLEKSHPVAAMAVDRAGRFGDALIIRLGAGTDDTNAWKEINIDPESKDISALLKAIMLVIDGEDPESKAADVNLTAGTLTEITGAVSNKSSITIITPSFFESADHDTGKCLLEFLEKCGQLEKGRNRVLMLSAYSNAAGVLLTGGTPHFGPGLTKLNDHAGLDRCGIEKAVKAGKIKALLTFGDGNYELTGKSDLFVIAAGSSISGVPDGTDIIFTTQPQYNKNGYFTNSSGQTRINKSLSTDAALVGADWRLICDLARALGSKWGFKSIEDVRLEMKSLTPAD